MGDVVTPSRLGHAAAVPITPADGVNNLRMDGVAYRFLHNEGTSAVTVNIRTSTASAGQLYTINSGDALDLPHNAQGVQATGTTGGAGQTGLRALL